MKRELPPKRSSRMKKYYFYDTDDSGNADYDIAGADYCQLLETCLKYCSSVSFVVCSRNGVASEVPVEIEKYRIPVTDSLLKHYKQSERREAPEGWYEIRHYCLCTDVANMLTAVSDSVFKWVCAWGYSNPEDVAFWREDGTAFFTSVTHEGECFLMPNDDEDVDNIVSSSLWSPSSKRVFPSS